MDPFAAASSLFSAFGPMPSEEEKKRKSVVDLAEDVKRRRVEESPSIIPEQIENKKKRKKKSKGKSKEATSAETTTGKQTNGDEDVELTENADEIEFERTPLENDDNTEQTTVATTSSSAEEPKEGAYENVFGPLSSRHACSHEVALPAGYTGPNPLHTNPPPRKPAKEYPFQLDSFQLESVKAIEKGESVLVSAHTSAGKTAVAEYAIAMSLCDGARVIYTSPIKALSNQKYRELAEEFEDVGLMTGDVTINPHASCLVMTTEILRSMLYRGSEILREVAWVIFDEVHYMRDKERGVVWEETMILLPDKVKYVFLSATIPNAIEFAGWIANLHNQVVHVVYTDYRPTPLQHYIFPRGGDGIHLTIDENGRFRDDNFQKAVRTLDAAAETTKKRDFKDKKLTGSDVYKIVKMIMERSYQPVIVFSFSKRDCEALALQMSKLDFNDDEEKALVEEVFTNAIDSLSDDDKKLPQVEYMMPLLKRGVGIHHSGLLPIIKEVIEILFQEGLVKALFSTETFSMGLNMPAKTVVFTNIQKWDGVTFRTISSGEYIQMSGRAGRRGLDDRGIVILMMDQKIDQATAKKMMAGKADPLNSSFHLSYYMILNLLRVEDIDPEYIMERSFFQYQNSRNKPALEQALEERTKQLSNIRVENEHEIKSYYDIRKQLDQLRDQIREVVIRPIYSLQYLQPGRLVKVRDGADDWGWGVVINFQKKKSAEASLTTDKASDYIVDVLLNCAPVKKGEKAKPRPCLPGEEGSIMVVPIQMDLIEQISTVRVYIPKNLKSEVSCKSVFIRINEVKKRFPDGIPVFDPIEDLHIEDEDLAKSVKRVETLEMSLQANPLRDSPQLQELYAQYQKKLEMEEEVRSLKRRVKEAGQLILKDELKARMRVLRRLGFTNQDNVIQVKGRVACEISAGDEIVLTELMFNGVFTNLTPEQTVALLSCFVFDEASSSESGQALREELEAPLRLLRETARRVAQVSQESKLEIDEAKYVSSFNPKLMEVTFAWCNGAKFSELCKMTDIFEGSIIRAMRNLEELLRQMCAASKAIGNDTLEAKFLAGIEKIKRDIVFSSSLYL